MKANQTIFLFMFSFFVVVGLGSLLLFSGKGSIIDRGSDSIGATTAALSETIIGNSNLEQPENQKVSDTIVDDVTDNQNDSEGNTEEILDDVEEKSIEETNDFSIDDNAASDYEIRYFMYTINTERHALRLREYPSEDSKILKKLNKSTSGYVTKPGNEWCKVITVGGIEGYLSTEYLTLEELSKEDYPQDYLSKVESPDEELKY